MPINKVIYDGETLIDLTPVSVTPETLAEGATAMNAAGELIVGEMSGNNGGSDLSNGGTINGDLQVNGEISTNFGMTIDTSDSGTLNFIHGDEGFYLYDESPSDDKPVLAFCGTLGDERVRLSRIETPIDDYDAANKKYVDDNFLPTSGGSVDGNITATGEITAKIVRGLNGITSDDGIDAQGSITAGRDISAPTIYAENLHLPSDIYQGGGVVLTDESDALDEPVLAFYGAYGDDPTRLRYIGDPVEPYDAATKRYVDSKIGGGGASIIDVTELPTENIDENVFYRLVTGDMVYYQDIFALITVHCVETTPEIGVPLTDSDWIQFHVYYSTAVGEIYSYIDEALADETSLPVGWAGENVTFETIGEGNFGGVTTDITYADDDLLYLLLSYALYSYKDGWVSHKAIGTSGEGTYAEVFNHPSNTADGHNAHAEGRGTHANAPASHAEGLGTIAGGDFSHSEGCGTRAVGRSQHVQGEYNILDPGFDINNPNRRGKYAHIVGNGTFDNRSNAHTLDWDGNAWFAGTVEAADPVSPHHAATKGYVDSMSLANGGVVNGNLEVVDGDLFLSPDHALVFADESGDGGSTIRDASPSPDKPVLAFLGGVYDDDVRLHGVATPIEDNDAATKGYVDDNFVPISGGDIHLEVQGIYTYAGGIYSEGTIYAEGPIDTDGYIAAYDDIVSHAGGIVLTSPNGTRYRITVADDGTLTTSKVTE